MLGRLLALGAAGFAGYHIYKSRQGDDASADENGSTAASRTKKKAIEPPQTKPGKAKAGTPRKKASTTQTPETRDDLTKIDRELEQSFPASDPPANY